MRTQRPRQPAPSSCQIVGGGKRDSLVRDSISSPYDGMTESHFPPSEPMLVYAFYTVLKGTYSLNNFRPLLNTKGRNSLFDRAYRRRDTRSRTNGGSQQRHLDNNAPLRSQKLQHSVSISRTVQVSLL